MPARWRAGALVDEWTAMSSYDDDDDDDDVTTTTTPEVTTGLTFGPGMEFVTIPGREAYPFRSAIGPVAGALALLLMLLSLVTVVVILMKRRNRRQADAIARLFMPTPSSTGYSAYNIEADERTSYTSLNHPSGFGLRADRRLVNSREYVAARYTYDEPTIACTAVGSVRPGSSSDYHEPRAALVRNGGITATHLTTGTEVESTISSSPGVASGTEVGPSDEIYYSCVNDMLVSPKAESHKHAVAADAEDEFYSLIEANGLSTPDDRACLIQLNPFTEEGGESTHRPFYFTLENSPGNAAVRSADENAARRTPADSGGVAASEYPGFQPGDVACTTPGAKRQFSAAAAAAGEPPTRDRQSVRYLRLADSHSHPPPPQDAHTVTSCSRHQTSDPVVRPSSCASSSDSPEHGSSNLYNTLQRRKRSTAVLSNTSVAGDDVYDVIIME